MAASVTQELDLNGGLSCLQEIQATQGLQAPWVFGLLLFIFAYFKSLL